MTAQQTSTQRISRSGELIPREAATTRVGTTRAGVIMPANERGTLPARFGWRTPVRPRKEAAVA